MGRVAILCLPVALLFFLLASYAWDRSVVVYDANLFGWPYRVFEESQCQEGAPCRQFYLASLALDVALFYVPLLALVAAFRSTKKRRVDTGTLDSSEAPRDV